MIVKAEARAEAVSMRPEYATEELAAKVLRQSREVVGAEGTVLFGERGADRRVLPGDGACV